MCRAIQASDNDSVQLLWQCGRSVTLTCVSGGDKTYLLQRSLMASEDYQTASELTDTWSHWAAKVNQLLSTFSSKKPAEQEKFLKARDISFRGAQASKALVNGIVAMLPLFGGMLGRLENDRQGVRSCCVQFWLREAGASVANCCITACRGIAFSKAGGD